MLDIKSGKIALDCESSVTQSGAIFFYALSRKSAPMRKNHGKAADTGARSLTAERESTPARRSR